MIAAEATIVKASDGKASDGSSRPSAPDDTVSRNAPLAVVGGTGQFREMRWKDAVHATRYSAVGLALLWIAGPASSAGMDSAGEYGPRPVIPAPTKSMVPTL